MVGSSAVASDYCLWEAGGWRLEFWLGEESSSLPGCLGQFRLPSSYQSLASQMMVIYPHSPGAGWPRSSHHRVGSSSTTFSLCPNKAVPLCVYVLVTSSYDAGPIRLRPTQWTSL
jgi:hypothetical protein